MAKYETKEAGAKDAADDHDRGNGRGLSSAQARAQARTARGHGAHGTADHWDGYADEAKRRGN